MSQSSTKEATQKPQSIFPESWRELKDGTVILLAAKCNQCGTHYFPGVPICTVCQTEKFSITELSSRANLYSFSTIHVDRKGFNMPLTVGFADFPEGVRVFGQIVCDDPEVLVPDAPVTVKIGTLFVKEGAEGRTPIIGHIFVPVQA